MTEKAMALQYSCLENPRDRGAWWAAVYGIGQSRTWLKWLSSSSMEEKMENKTVLSSVQFQFSLVTQSCPTLCEPMDCSIRLPCPSPTPGDCSNSCTLSWWCHPTISASVVPFSSHLQSFWASGSFPMNQLLTSGGQSTGVSASASVLPINIQDWFPLGWTGWISLQSKALSRVLCNTTVQKHHFFGVHLSL